jgi:hypothetical protein
MKAAALIVALSIDFYFAGGRDRDRTGDPLLAKHATSLQQLYHLFLTTNVSNKSGNLLFAQSYPQWHENVGFLHSPCTASASRMIRATRLWFTVIPCDRRDVQMDYCRGRDDHC